MKKLIAGALLLTTVLALGMYDAPEADRKAVERAVLDYCEAFYKVKPELIERSVHPDLNKFGFHRSSPDEKYRRIPMSYEKLVELAGKWNKDGGLGENPPSKVEVFDVLDQTACAKLTAFWGIDYLLLARYDGRWKIVQVLWQSHPPETD